MGFGSSYVSSHAEFALDHNELNQKCTGVLINVVTIQDRPFICTKENILHIALDNSNRLSIDNVKIRVLGSLGVSNIDHPLTEPLSPGDGAHIQVPLEKVGTPLEVSIAPQIEDNGNLIDCLDQTFHYQKPQGCTE